MHGVLNRPQYRRRLHRARRLVQRWRSAKRPAPDWTPKLALFQYCKHIALEPSLDGLLPLYFRFQEAERKDTMLWLDGLQVAMDELARAQALLRFSILETLAISPYTRQAHARLIAPLLPSSHSREMYRAADLILNTTAVNVCCRRVDRGWPFTEMSRDVLDRSTCDMRLGRYEYERPNDIVQYVHIDESCYDWPVAYNSKVVYMYHQDSPTPGRSINLYYKLKNLIHTVRKLRPCDPVAYRIKGVRVDVDIRIPRRYFASYRDSGDGIAFDQAEADRILAAVVAESNLDPAIGDAFAVTIVDGEQRCPACAMPCS